MFFGCTKEDPSCAVPLGTGTYTEPSAIGETRLALSWTHESGSDFYTVEYGVEGFALGTGISETFPNSPETRPFIARGLLHETTYDFYVRVDCTDGGTSNFAGPVQGTTKAFGEGCTPPVNLVVDAVTSNSVQISWEYFGNGIFWDVTWTASGSSQGNSTTAILPEILIEDLQPATTYEIRIRTDCYVGFYPYSDPTFDGVVEVTTSD